MVQQNQMHEVYPDVCFNPFVNLLVSSCGTGACLPPVLENFAGPKAVED